MTFSIKIKTQNQISLKIRGCKISFSKNLWVQLHPLHPTLMRDLTTQCTPSITNTTVNTVSVSRLCSAELEFYLVMTNNATAVKS